jgi:hypothetical protein
MKDDPDSESCFLCGKIIKILWNGMQSTTCCFASYEFNCGKRFCEEHVHPLSHSCSGYNRYLEFKSKGFKKFRFNSCVGCFGLFWANDNGIFEPMQIGQMLAQMRFPGAKLESPIVEEVFCDGLLTPYIRKNTSGMTEIQIRDLYIAEGNFWPMPPKQQQDA